jgi:hypothetical protein
MANPLERAKQLFGGRETEIQRGIRRSRIREGLADAFDKYYNDSRPPGQDDDLDRTLLLKYGTQRGSNITIRQKNIYSDPSLVNPWTLFHNYLSTAIAAAEGSERVNVKSDYRIIDNRVRNARPDILRTFERQRAQWLSFDTILEAAMDIPNFNFNGAVEQIDESFVTMMRAWVGKIVQNHGVDTIVPRL